MLPFIALLCAGFYASYICQGHIIIHPLIWAFVNQFSKYKSSCQLEGDNYYVAVNFQTEERYQHFISFLPTYNILILKKKVGLGFRQYLSYNMAVSFIGEGNWSAQRKPLTCRKSLTNFITLHLYVVCSTPRHGYAYFVIQLNIANCKLLFPFQ